MRTCPVCENKKRERHWRQTFLVPEGWTQPDRLDWFVCQNCGMIYADADITQADYDKYYLEKYGYGVEDKEACKRQQEHAQWAVQALKDRHMPIVDFGGTGVLTGYLREYGFTNCLDIGPGQEIPPNAWAIFAEHVLEHIYNVPETMRKIHAAMIPAGCWWWMVQKLLDSGA